MSTINLVEDPDYEDRFMIDTEAVRPIEQQCLVASVQETLVQISGYPNLSINEQSNIYFMFLKICTSLNVIPQDILQPSLQAHQLTQLLTHQTGQFTTIAQTLQQNLQWTLAEKVSYVYLETEFVPLKVASFAARHSVFNPQIVSDDRISDGMTEARNRVNVRFDSMKQKLDREYKSSTCPQYAADVAADEVDVAYRMSAAARGECRMILKGRWPPH